MYVYMYSPEGDNSLQLASIFQSKQSTLPPKQQHQETYANRPGPARPNTELASSFIFIFPTSCFFGTLRLIMHDSFLFTHGVASF